MAAPLRPAVRSPGRRSRAALLGAGRRRGRGPGMHAQRHALPAIAHDVSRFEHDVTTLLRERNELLLEGAHAGQEAAVVDAHGRADLPAAWGGVTLVIVTG